MPIMETKQVFNCHKCVHVYTAASLHPCNICEWGEEHGSEFTPKEQHQITMEHIEMKSVEELDYENLIERVRQLDPAAAEYLEGPAKEMSDFSYTGNLWDAFTWDDSIQGHTYWQKIAEALDREEDKRVSIDQASPEEWDAVSKKAMDSLKRQVGGSHYKGFKIEPIEFSMANNLNACQHSIVKYVVRNKGTKEQRIQDLNKARHFIDILEETILSEEA
jgi:hypothetical protein